MHGSAPNIAGKHLANPVATFLSAVMMLNFIGEAPSASRLRRAVVECLAERAVTPDLGGMLSTEQVTDRVLKALENISERN